ncbi:MULTISPECIES: stealth conserved region 3 domain-containing protein [unclassified Streptomyces]|uniref:stealth conserved region 3 domain-containing protein n=1 Tax=Streptomyces sp. NPDC127129 TaxID=3345373 RepID=UPI00362EE82F
MKITILLTWGDAMGGTEMAAYTQAAQLMPRHEVEILSVFKTAPEPFLPEAKSVAIRYLVDRSGGTPRPVRASSLTAQECEALASLPSELIQESWEPTFDRLSDIEMTAALSGIETDVLITTTPALMAAAVSLVPSRVVTVHQEHRVSQLRGATGEPLLTHAPQLDALVSLTELTTDWFSESLGASAPRLATIPNAMPDGYRPRSDLGSKTIVVAGRMVPEKQLDHAVQAFADIAADHPDWSLRLFGDGPQLVNLRRLVEGLGMHNRVELVGRSQEMAKEWAKAAICLMPSRVESFGLVMLEAFTAGVPVVAYDALTGPSQIVRHEVDGLLVPADDVTSLGAAMSRLMGDDDLRTAFGAAARSGARERFAPEIITSQWDELFAEILAERDAPKRVADRADRVARRIAAGGSRSFALSAPISKLSPSSDEQKAREVILQAQDRHKLVRSAGRLAEVSDETLAWRMAEINLELCAQAFERHDVRYILLHDPAAVGHRLAVRAEDRERALRALGTEMNGRPVYAELVTPRTAAPGAVLAESLTAVPDVDGVRVFRPLVSESRTLRYGPAYGCRVEFWSADDSGWFAAPTGTTLVGPRLPSLEESARITIGDRDYPTSDVFTKSLMWNVDFPIDAVYTWVDDTDPAWRKKRDAARKAHGMPVDGAEAGDVRFRNRDELRYSLRSLATHAPWIRKIFLVTDDQTPSWLNTEHPDIQVVSHSEIFADPSWLPTFNSHAIESQLHRIEGLSEHFLYVNDDVFFGRPLAPNKFFQSNGNSLFFRSPTAVPPGEITEETEGYFVAAKNNQALLEEDFGRVATHGFLHTPHPLRRSVLEEISERWPERSRETAATPFRGRADLSITSSLHHHYAYLTGKAAQGGISCGYANIGDYKHHVMLSRLLAARHRDVFCIGESAEAEVPVDEQDRVLRAFLEAYFPVRSPYERD